MPTMHKHKRTQAQSHIPHTHTHCARARAWCTVHGAHKHTRTHTQHTYIHTYAGRCREKQGEAGRCSTDITRFSDELATPLRQHSSLVDRCARGLWSVIHSCSSSAAMAADSRFSAVVVSASRSPGARPRPRLCQASLLLLITIPLSITITMLHCNLIYERVQLASLELRARGAGCGATLSSATRRC